MSRAIVVFKALTSLHPGAGSAVGAIDLSIQREKHTQWPMMQSGGIKGVFREAAREANGGQETEELKAVFGPPVTDAGDHAGALVVTDARTLFFPIRSLKGIYALVTCPQALRRFAEDYHLAGMGDLNWPDITPAETLPQAYCCDADSLFWPQNDAAAQSVFGDLEFAHASSEEWNTCVSKLAELSGQEAGRIVLVSDDIFTYFVRFHTEVISRNSLEAETKTVKHGALWNEEYLPPQSILYSVLLADRVYSDQSVDIMENIRNWIVDRTLQFGGGASTGKGFCKVTMIPRGTDHGQN